MSMVGYILGLGDRHPSNLMMDRITGNIIHIDFGDCFEVAMQREKYPERVPFRLTRMLTYAMEVSTIEGSFRTTCEHVMRVLRDNKESLMAVLEAFIHDPLLTWRLDPREDNFETHFPSERRASILGIEPEQTTHRGAPPVGSLSTGPPGPARKRASTASQRPNMQAITSTNVDAVAINNVNGTVMNRESAREGAREAREDPEQAKEVQNARALQVLARVKEKLTGTDFKPYEELDVSTQVDKLICEATNLENLCQHYVGW